MHGTFVNDKRIPVGMDVALKNNDILTFGTEVNRGTGKLLRLHVSVQLAPLDQYVLTPFNRNICTP